MAEPWRRLEGKVVMVTGASSGIGLELCLDLAKAGCNVIAAARRIERLKSLCDHINQIPSPEPSSCGLEQKCPARAVAVELDVSSDGKSIEASVRRAWDAFGRIDTLINNAGVRGTVKSALDLSEDEWNSTIKTNLTGTWLVSKYVGIHMRDAKIGGSIINVASIAGINRGQVPGGVAYSASKGAVNMITKVMAVEFGPSRIRVNAINPGLFRSEITQALMEKDWLHTVAQRTIPLRANGTVDPALTSTVRVFTSSSTSALRALHCVFFSWSALVDASVACSIATQIANACNVDSCAWKSTAYFPFPWKCMVNAGAFSFGPCTSVRELSVTNQNFNNKPSSGSKR